MTYHKSFKQHDFIWGLPTSKNRKRIIENLTSGKELMFQGTAGRSDDITTFVV